MTAPSTRSPRSYLNNLTQAVGPTGLGPVFVLMLAFGIERFAVTAVGILAPNIRDTFHVSNQTFITVSTLTSILPAVASAHMGYLADRMNRVRLAIIGTVAVGVVGIGLGLVPTFWLFGVLLFAVGLGQLVNTPTHSSLITDYYPPSAQGITWTFYLFASGAIGLVAGPVSGVIASVAGWRGAFIILSAPVIASVALLVRLRDPGRGASVGMTGALTQNEESASFWEGFRRLRAIRSLRRTWWAAAFFGGGIVAFTNLQSIFFHDVYHFGTAARGYLTAVFGVAGLAGTITGGRYVQRWLRTAKPELLPVVNGLMVVEFGVGMILMGVVPGRWLAVAMLFVLGIGAAGFAPAYQAMIGLVTTPRLRGQAYSYSLIWVTIGAIIVSPVIGGIANHHERAATWVLGILMVMAGIVEVTARKFVPRDVAQALAVQAAADVDSILTIRGLEVAYTGNLQILFGVDLDVNEGEIVALLGTNGAGKSTLLKAVSGTMDPIGGVIYFNGRDVTHADAVTKATLGMALVPGDRGVFPSLTVADNLRIAGWMLRKDQAFLAQSTDKVLGYFPVLRERWNVPAGNLSGGEQQMLALGQALLGRPKLLMIDELSLGLAPAIVSQLLETVRRLAEDGITILLVEQSVNVALTLARRAVFMEKGEIRFSGPTEELLNRPDVLRAVFLEGTASAMGDQAPSAEEPAADEPVEPATSSFGTSYRTSGLNGHISAGPALETVGISKRFGGVTATQDVSITLHRGEILGLMGPNGAGKTTIFDLISGFIPLDSGQVFLDGSDITNLSPDTRARLGLGRSFQDSKLFPALTVQETIKVAFECHLEMRDPLAAAVRLPAIADAEREVQSRVDELVEMVGLSAFRNKFVSELSTGTRRMVDLACLLAHEPKVILFDEPSSGIAQRETEALGPVLRRIREMTDSSLLVIEHDMPLLTGLADEVIALELGRTVVRGRPQTVLTDPRVVAAYLGTSTEAVFRSGSLHPGEEAETGSAARPGRGGRAPGVTKRAPARKRAAKTTKATGTKARKTSGVAKSALGATRAQTTKTTTKATPATAPAENSG
jgi:ABC-type branched-subunit amino acid transport system ATPase component/sugar phosphate permease